MLPYLIAGLAVGALYALSTMALVVTYNASRVFNFAQGGMAFFLAYFFYWLHTTYAVPIWLAAVITVVVVGPLLGLFLWWILLGRLTELSVLTKVAVMIGLQILLVASTFLIFGNEPVYNPVGPVGDPQSIFTIFDVNVSNEQFVVIIVAALVALVGYWILNRTTAGLVTRGAVDSTLMTTLTGTNPKMVVAITWMVGTGLAGLAGIFLLPKVGLSASGFSNLVAVSMAGAVIGKFTKLWRALLGALVVGVTQEVLILYIPADGFLSTALRPSIPFLFMVGALLIYSRSRDVRAEAQKTEVAASNNSYEVSLSHYLNIMRNPKGHWDRWVGFGALAIVIAGVPWIMNDYWIGLVAVGFCYTTTFLSYRLVTGEAGIISLSQISFAGIGALSAGYILNNDTVFGMGSLGQVNVLVAMLVGAIISGVLGTLVGLVCLPLGPLYAAISTFAFALLVDQVVYTQPQFDNYGSGLPFARPEIFGFVFDTPRSYYWFAFVVMVIVMFVLWSLRRSTSGLVFATIRASRVRAATLGFDIYIARVAVFALGAAVAGLGGSMLASFQFVAFPGGYYMTIGLVWFALAVALGTSSLGGLAAAGMFLMIGPEIFHTFLPERLSEVPAMLFGLLAINMVRDPIGIQPKQRAAIRAIAIKLSGGSVHSDSSSAKRATDVRVETGA